MHKKQQKGKSLSSFYFRFLQPGVAIIGFLESAVGRAGAGQNSSFPLFPWCRESTCTHFTQKLTS
jgi:hypothetical protein